MDICSNCNQRIKDTSHFHEGYGAGAGQILSGIRVCPSCKSGCCKWEKDDIPGFKESASYPCCKCGVTHEYHKIKNL